MENISLDWALPPTSTLYVFCFGETRNSRYLPPQVPRKTQVPPSGLFSVASTNFRHSYMAMKGKGGTGTVLEKRGCPGMWNTANFESWRFGLWCSMPCCSKQWKFMSPIYMKQAVQQVWTSSIPLRRAVLQVFDVSDYVATSDAARKLEASTRLKWRCLWCPNGSITNFWPDGAPLLPPMLHSPSNSSKKHEKLLWYGMRFLSKSINSYDYCTHASNP